MKRWLLRRLLPTAHDALTYAHERQKAAVGSAHIKVQPNVDSFTLDIARAQLKLQDAYAHRD